MKRTPKSFDATNRQDPKHLVLVNEMEDIFEGEEACGNGITEVHNAPNGALTANDSDNNSISLGDDLSANLTRLQVSSSSTTSGVVNSSTQEEATLLNGSGSDEVFMSNSSTSSTLAAPTENQMTKEINTTPSFKNERKSSSKKKKKRDQNADLLASLNTAVASMQEEEEQSFSRCLDSGVRSANLTGFFFAKDEEQKQFTVFRIEVITVAQAWAVYRRYSDFVTLAAKLQNLSPPNFPPKTPFGGNFAKDFLQKRQTQLSQWLERALSVPGVVTLSEMRMFLVSEANCQPTLIITEQGNSTSKSSTSSTGSSLETKDVITAVTLASIAENEVAATPKRDVVMSSAIAETPNGLNIVYSDTSPGTPRTHLKSPYQQNTRKVSMGDFELLQVLGKGSFGKVVLAMKRTGRDANTLYAMKILNKQNVVIKKQVEHTLTERSVLGKMNHPFIVKLHYAFQTEKKLHFVLDYCPGGELFFHLGRAGRFSEEQGCFYAAEMTLALGHLHSHGVVYRDLKPENILFEANGHLKLADFGLSKEGVESTQGSHSFCGTPEYLAPEVLNRSGHGTAVDWWSLGALLYEMLTGLPPWFSQDRQKLFMGIKTAPLRFPPEVSPLAKSVLSEFLKRDPLDRLGSGGVEQVKKHPFFASIDWVALYELRIPAPFIPRLLSSLDTANFDATFTRLPLYSEAASPVHTLMPSSASNAHHLPVFPAVSNGQHQNANNNKKGHDDALFGGFTYQEEVGIATPPTPYSGSGFCTPPPLPAIKRTSPLRPTNTHMYHARPSSSASSSITKTPSFVPASSPTVSG